jgi:hypothetical protein
MNLLSGLKCARLDRCVHYLEGKQKIVSFKRHPPSKNKELLELVHSNVCCPLKEKYFSCA